MKDSKLKSIYLIALSGILLLADCQNVKEDRSEIPENEEPAMNVKYIFSGTYTRKEGHVDGKAEGIDVFRIYDDQVPVHSYTAKEVVNPSYLAISGNGKFLYSVNETGPNVDTAGSISSYKINAEEGSLEPINTQSSHGFAPCYISLDSKNRMAFVVNYAGGIVAIYPIKADGSLQEASQVIHLEGRGPDPRQEASHPHSIVLSPDENFAYVADLGTDKIMSYQIDYDQKSLIPAKVPFINLDPGSGPRHTVFHPDQPFFYVINELNSTLSVFRHDRENGSLSPLQTVNTLPDDFEGENWCADIHITPDGKYLFGTNRGHNSLVSFAIDAISGELTLIGFESTRGDVPRNFLIDGRELYVANQNSDNVVLFDIDENGNLEYQLEFEAKTPVCLKSRVYNQVAR